MKVDVVILGGGDGEVVDPTCRFKGLAAVAGRPMIEWVVDATRDAEFIQSVAAVVPSAEDLGPWADKVDKLVVSDGDFMENLIAGFESFRVDRPVLVTTGDVPLLVGAELDDFISACLATAADFAYPVIRREDLLRQFPDAERTFIKLASGPVTGGNMAILNPALVARSRELGTRLFEARKSPVRMARILGLGFVLKLVRGRLNVRELEAKMGELLGGPSAAVYTAHASIGMDVDKPSDLVLVERALGLRPGGIHETC